MDKPTEQTQLRILLLEDVPTDAELMEEALREAGLSFIAKRVDTREAFIRALEEFKPDIVLADYKLPSFDGGAALKIVRQQYPTIPVVMVTGAMGDEKAIELLKQGARDYVLKDRLGRLGTEVRRVLAEERDIRARKAAEQTLRQSEADFRALVEQSPIAMLVDAGVGADAKTVMMNRKFTELFGYTPADVPDEQHWWPLAYPDEAYREEIKTEWTQRAEEASRNRSSIEPMEASITCKDGAIRYIRISFTSIGDKNILGFEDLTKRKQAEDELERFFNLIPDPVCIASADGHFLKINPAWQELLRYTTQEILAKPFLDLIHPDDRAATMKEVERQLAGEATMRFSNRYRCKDGSYKWLEWKATPAVGGQLLFASARDITERRQAEARIQKLTRLYATLSQINQIIVRSTTNREELFLSICSAAVTHGDFIMAWVGLVDETTRTVKPVCHYGAENGYLTNIDVSIDDVPSGRGPTGTAIRDNGVSYVNDYASDERTLPWRVAALQRGFRCAAGLPLRFGDKVIGALTLYTDEPGFFDADQLNLLEEMATDVSFALNNIAHEAERSAAELQLKERERQYHTLADSGQALIWTADTDKLCDYFNKVWLEFTGRTLEQLLGNGWADDVHPDDFDQCLATYVDAFDRREPFSMLYRLRRHDGEYRWLQDDGCPRYNTAGEFIGYIGYCLDITENKKAEAGLAESAQHFRAVAESANDAIITISGSGDIVDWNPAAERLFGHSKAEITALPLTVLMPERFRDLHSTGLSRVNSGGTPHVIGKAVELAGLRKDGSEFPLELSLAQWHSGQSQFFTAIIRDIAERKTLEGQLATQYQQLKDAHEQLLESSKQLKATQSQLMQSAKMASIGLLAAGVAHEINNPIGYVNSNMGTLEKYLADIFAVIDKFEDAEMVMGMLMDANDPLLEELRQFKKKINLDYVRKDIKDLLTESHQGLERVKRIVLDLKNFSHADSDDQWLWADIHQVLDATLNVVWNELKYKCEVVKEYGVLPEIYCLPTQLDQVFMNLLVNAAQAIEVRGKITIRTGQEGDRVWVEVSDTGKGIPPEDFPNLFDPFFTTKPVGKGTGLGLSVSYSIVEKHHGKIEVHSEVGKGSTFRVWLPVRQPDVREAASPASNPMK
ncbi:MAG: PAS domain S-box protein [Gallionella sp.]|nr:PAS domain S-box protein [Gallionella sp.]